MSINYYKLSDSITALSDTNILLHWFSDFIIASFYTEQSAIQPSFYILHRFLTDPFLSHFVPQYFSFWGTGWRSWLRQCATSRKVAGTVPDRVTRIFHWLNPSSRSMALGSTQPLTQMSTRANSWGVKAAGAQG
jgi:hypothetical protein